MYDRHMSIGNRFDKLEVVSAPYLKPMEDHRRRRWVKVRCDCGKTTEALEYNLRVGRIRSCGCAQGAPRALVTIGERFGRLVVIGERYLKSVGGRGRSHVLVRCDCGTETEAGVTNLRRGNTQSCGCMVREATIARSTTHGATATRLYRIWRGMHKRCSNPNADSPGNCRWITKKANAQVPPDVQEADGHRHASLDMSADHDVVHVMKPAPTPRVSAQRRDRQAVTQIKDAVPMRLDDNGGEPSMA
jgi:hypothetical protein